jgi:hypothetical protein
MLNLIIQTQYKENYAAHNEDYVHGVSESYWKFKGGSTYLVTDIDFINTEYLEGLVEETAFIHSYENPASMEYVLDWELIDEENLSDHIEEWESPYILEKNEKGQWTSKKVTENGDMGYMKSEILSKVAVWTYESNGTRDVESYHVEYVMVDGTKVVGEKSLGEWFENLETEVA